MDSLSAFLQLQLFRITNHLKVPLPHASGPRRLDLDGQEAKIKLPPKVGKS